MIPDDGVVDAWLPLFKDRKAEWIVMKKKIGDRVGEAAVAAVTRGSGVAFGSRAVRLGPCAPDGGRQCGMVRGGGWHECVDAITDGS